MKNKTALFAAVLAAAMVVSASETTSSMAVAAANAWASANAQAFAPSGSAAEAIAERDPDGSLLWWVVPFSGGGAVVVAPDTRIEPVIAALPSYGGPLPEKHPLRVLLTFDLQNRLKLVKGVQEASAGRRLKSSGGSADSPNADVVQSAAEAKAKWGELVPTGPVRLKANPTYPLPITGAANPAYVIGMCPGFEYGGVLTHWNQSYSPYSSEPDGNCYNYYTPRHAVCGCVATAGAAVMQFFGNTGPTFNVTNICTWGDPMITPGYYYAAPFTMVGATNAYDWSILPVSMGGQGDFDGGALTKEQVELLGRATYDMGVGVSMAWAMDGMESGAVTADLAAAFRRYYGFKDARGVFVGVPPEDDEYYEAASPAYIDSYGVYNDRLLYAQLRNNIPVPLGIRTKDLESGHAVVAVGYGRDFLGTSYTRVFMGWAGSSDAWYCLPAIDSFRVVNQYITMIGKDDRKTMPVVGRVVNESGEGAAFAEIDVGGVTNVFTDANGYWATRIDESGLSLSAEQVVMYEFVSTNSCPAEDEEVVAAIDEAVNAFNEESGGEDVMEMGPLPARVGGETIDDAYVERFSVFSEEVTEDLEDGSQTNYVILVTNFTVLARVYTLPVKCMASGETVDVPVGAMAFDEGTYYYNDTENNELMSKALANSIPDEVNFTVPDDSALVAWSGATDPDVAAAAAAEDGKMMFFLSGDPETDEYKAILAYIQADAAGFGEKYVLVLIDPSSDPYNLADGNPSFGVFDPTIFNSQAPNRWAFYNGRLSYFDASDGVTDEDVQRVLDEGEARYAKLHDDIRVTVVSDNCNFVNSMLAPEPTPEEEAAMANVAAIWGDGIPDDAEGFSADAKDWLGNDIVGQGVFTNAFVDGQGVTFTAPPAVTNNNIVWVPVGWRLSDLEEEEELLELYDFWKNGSEDDWNAAFEEFEDFLPKPEEFSPSDFGFLWIENDSADPDSAPVLMASGDDLKLTWLWEPREVYISAEAVNGTVAPGSGWYAFSVDEGDKVEFTASTDITGAAFVGWKGAPEDVDAGSSAIQVQPDGPLSLVANFSTDKNFYSLSFVDDPATVSGETIVTWNGATQNMTGNRISKRPGYVVASNATESVEVDGKTLICAGWTATGSAPAHGTGNVCEFPFTESTEITWLWREAGWVDPYDDAAITFTVDAGEGAPEGDASPSAGTYVNMYTNGETIVCTSVPGITNTVDSIAVVCAGWTLTDNLSGDEVASGSGSEAEITFEKDVDWTLSWLWQTNELVHIVVNVDRGTASAPDDYYPVGSTVEVVVTGQKAVVFDHWSGDTNGCVFAGYDSVEGYTIKIPADSDRVINAYLGPARGLANLSICSVYTNGANGAACELGSPDPGYVVERELATGGTLNLVMNDYAETNIVGDVTNIWVCSGWKLFNVQTNLLADDEHLLAEGDGPVASFQFSCDSTLVWIWKAPGPAERPRSPLPDTLEGPDGAAPITVGPGSAVAKIANTAYGWWYGLYSKVSLTDPEEDWTLVPGKAAVAEDDNVLITLEVQWDPAEPAKFFKVIVTEDDPR